jgi:hypothetical protein
MQYPLTIAVHLDVKEYSDVGMKKMSRKLDGSVHLDRGPRLLEWR